MKHWKPYMLRPVIYMAATRLMAALVFLLAVVRFVPRGPAPGMVAGFLTVLFALFTYLVYLRMDGMHIPRMTLQPLLENAVLHGYADPKGACPVFVRVWREDEHVCIEVEDRGCGMDDALLAQLNADLAGCSREQMLSLETDRIGVINICCRLLFMFGDDVSMRYEHAQPCGTRVSIAYNRNADKRLMEA